jgi:hypothetical protein
MAFQFFIKANDFLTLWSSMDRDKSLPHEFASTQASRSYPTLVDGAMRVELKQLRERGTFVPIHGAPTGEKVVHSSHVDPKFGDNGELTLMKGRLVAADNEVDPSLYTMRLLHLLFVALV